MDGEWGPGDSSLLAGRYRMGARLGAGGMAEVFRAEDTRLGREVAVKVLRPELATDPAFRDRFEAEARAAGRLSHRNVVAVYDVGEGPHDRPFIVMELVAGGSLAERLRSGPLSQAEAVHVALEVLAALEAAHAAGIVHRDIKPGNILFSPDGSAKVADFGIAKALDGGVGDLTATSKVIGTPRYLPPERVEGRPATVESDLWGVGVVLHEALAGAYPFPGDTPLAAAVAAQRGQSTPLVVARPDVSPAVAAVADRALAPDPAGRYPSAAAMAGDLRAAAASVGPETAVLDPLPAGGVAAATTPLSWARPEGASPVPDRWRRVAGPWWRQPVVAALAAVALAVLLLALVWPGGGSVPAPIRSSTTTTRVATPVTAPPTTTTTVTCASLQAQRQALADQQKALGKPPKGKGPAQDAVRQALDTQIHALDQQIQQLCAPGGGGDQGDGG